jgi:hypothetical protein
MSSHSFPLILYFLRKRQRSIHNMKAHMAKEMLSNDLKIAFSWGGGGGGNDGKKGRGGEGFRGEKGERRK